MSSSPYGPGPAPQLSQPPQVYGYPPAYGYPPPPGAYPAQRPVRSGALGLVALLIAIAGLIASSAISAFSSATAARGASRELFIRSTQAPLDTPDELLSVLSPVRDVVLWAEIGFWVGTGAGIAALVLGIVAISSRSGRGSGIAAVVIACVAPVVYWIVVSLATTIGFGIGAV